MASPRPEDRRYDLFPLKEDSEGAGCLLKVISQKKFH